MENNGKRPIILLARPRGFCAGVDRAIAIVEKALKKFGTPVFVKHAIVHNRHVVKQLEEIGAVFVEEIEEIPKGGWVVFSAHGVSPQIRQEAAARDLRILDATCPLVTKVHTEALRFANENRTVLLIGHSEHVEVIGTQGEAPENILVIGNELDAEQVIVPNPEKVAYLTQTTLSLDDTNSIIRILKKRFSTIARPGKDDICYATQNRQNAVHALAKEVDVIIVVGSANSSNSNRLAEVGQARGIPTYLVESHHQIQDSWIENAKSIGITAGASAPERIVQEMVEFLSQLKNSTVREIEVVSENISFPLPELLRQ